MRFVRSILAAAFVAGISATSALAAGNLNTGATVVKIDMTADKKFSTNAIEMETGKGYNVDITKIGGGEYKFYAPDLFNNSYIFQIVIAGKEIKTRDIDFLEYDDAGTIRVSLVPNRIGSFKYWVAGEEGTMSGTITVK